MARLLVEFAERGASAVTKTISNVKDEIDSMPKSVDDLKTSFDNMDKIQLAGLIAALEGVGIAASGALKEVVNTASEFDTGIRKVNTLLDDNAQNSEDWEQVYKDVAIETGNGLSDVTEATYSALSAGVDYSEVQDFVIEANKLSKGGFTDLEGAIDVTTSVLNAYGLEASELDRISNILINTQNLGKTTVDELASSLSAVTPTAAATGIEFEQVGAGLAIMTAQGTPTAQATTQLNSLLAELSKSGTVASANFEELAGKSFQDFINEGGNVADAMVIMQEGADEQNLSMLDMFGSIEAGKAALAISSDADGFNSALKTMQEESGATQSAYEEMTGGIEGTQDRINASVEVLSATLGEFFLPILAEALEKIQAVVDFLLEHEGLLMGIAVALGVVVGAFVLLNVALGIYAIQTMIAALAQAALLWPIILVGLALIALIAIITAIIVKWEEITAALKKFVEDLLNELNIIWEGLKSFWDSVVEAFTKALDWIKEKIDIFVQTSINAWNDFKDSLINIWTALTETIKKIIDMWVYNVKSTIKVFFDTIKQYTKIFSSIFKGDWEGALNAVRELVEIWKEYVIGIFDNFGIDIVAIWEWIRDGISAVIDAITDKLNSWVEVVIGVRDRIVDAFNNIVVGISTGIQNGIDSLISKIKNMLNNFLIGPVNSANDVINKIPGVNIPDIPMLAKGGLVGVGNNGTLAMVGEAGPEAVIPLKDSVLSKIGNAIAESTNNSNISNNNKINNITFNISGGDAKSIKEEVEEALRLLALEGGIL